MLTIFARKQASLHWLCNILAWVKLSPLDTLLPKINQILSVALALNGNQFVPCKGNNSNNKMLKVYNFRIKSGIGKWSFYSNK
jgi:hypothetical protein